MSMLLKFHPAAAAASLTTLPKAWHTGTPHAMKSMVLPAGGFEGRAGTERLVGRCVSEVTKAWACARAELPLEEPELAPAVEALAPELLVGALEDDEAFELPQAPPRSASPALRARAPRSPNDRVNGVSPLLLSVCAVSRYGCRITLARLLLRTPPPEQDCKPLEDDGQAKVWTKERFGPNFCLTR